MIPEVQTAFNTFVQPFSYFNQTEAQKQRVSQFVQELTQIAEASGCAQDFYSSYATSSLAARYTQLTSELMSGSAAVPKEETYLQNPEICPSATEYTSSVVTDYANSVVADYTNSVVADTVTDQITEGLQNWAESRVGILGFVAGAIADYGEDLIGDKVEDGITKVSESSRRLFKKPVSKKESGDEK